MNQKEYEELLVRVDERVAATQKDVKQIREVHTKRLDAHAKEIDSLKKSRNRLWGAGAAVSALAGALGWDELAARLSGGG